MSFESGPKECWYGFRSKRSATDALEAIRLTGGRGHRYAVEIDIRKYFDSIDHDKLLRLVERRTSDRQVVELLRQWPKAGCWWRGGSKARTWGVPRAA